MANTQIWPYNGTSSLSTNTDDINTDDDWLSKFDSGPQLRSDWSNSDVFGENDAALPSWGVALPDHTKDRQLAPSKLRNAVSASMIEE